MEGQVYNTLDVNPSDLKAVQEGMKEVVDEGTATLAQVPGYKIAGKTGTAQAHIRLDGAVKRDLKTWFYCYGPFEAPRYVCCVMVEGGTWGGTTAAPIAQEIMKRLFAMDAGNVENVSFLQPAAGNFNGATVVEPTPAASTGVITGTNGSGVKTGSPAAESDTDDASTIPAADMPPRVVGNPGASTKRAH
jgi:membrane peptidoglycan carboxypeptidase